MWLTRPAAVHPEQVEDKVTRTRRVRLPGGLDVPYPEPSSSAASKVGKANRSVDTKPEVRLRSVLHRRGLRFRKDHLVREVATRARVDVCFPRQKVAVFVDGCFWHVCPIHGRQPGTNDSYWRPKLRANVARDRRVTEGLASAGWTVVRAWEHEDVQAVADRVEAALLDRVMSPSGVP